MLGNKETRISCICTRYTYADRRKDSEKDRCWNHVRGIFKSRNSNMLPSLNIFFITFSLSLSFVSLSFPYFLFFSFLFLFTCICILSTSYFPLFFRLLHFTLCHRREILTTLSSRQFFLSPPSINVLFVVQKMDNLTSFSNII